MTATYPPTTDAAALAILADVVRDVVAPNAQAVDTDGLFPQASYTALARAGVAGLQMPRELHGQECSTRTYATAMEEISAACGSTATVYMTQMHCAHPIHFAGTPEQQRTWIPALCTGETYGAIALTEPAAGSDISSMETTATRDGDDYLINGRKIFISNGDVAGVIVLFATVNRSAGRDGITAFLVDPRLPGFSAGTPMVKLGQKGASTVELVFDDYRLPAANRLGDEGQGYELLIRSVMKSRISAAAQGVGFARGAYEAAVTYCAEHELLSASRRDAQDLQFQLAELRAQIFAARAMLHTVCDLVDAADTDPAAEVAMVKLHCTALGVNVSSAIVELLGEDGDRTDLGAERRLRDAKITEIYDGTNQVQSMLIARDIRQHAISRHP